MYLCCFTSFRPVEWIGWVPWAKFYYNTSLHTSTHKTPFEVVDDRTTPNLFTYVPSTFRVNVINQMLRARDQVIQKLRCQL